MDLKMAEPLPTVESERQSYSDDPDQQVDDLRPAKGIIGSVLISAGLWSFVIGLWWSFG